MKDELKNLEALNEGDELHITIVDDGGEKTLPLTVNELRYDGHRPSAHMHYDGQTYGTLWGLYLDAELDRTVEFQTTRCAEDDRYEVTNIKVV